MIDDKGKIRCDAEIGSPGKGWCGCGKPATVECHNPRYSITLHFCERHRDRAAAESRQVTKELS